VLYSTDCTGGICHGAGNTKANWAYIKTIRFALDGGGQMVHYFFHMGGNTPSRMTGRLFEFLFLLLFLSFGL
jgi:hypothetical protein